MTFKIGDKIWALPETAKHSATLSLDLVKVLDRDRWSLQDIHEASQMIERMPIIKEVVLELLNRRVK